SAPSNSGWSRLVSGTPSRVPPSPLIRSPSHVGRPESHARLLLVVLVAQWRPLEELEHPRLLVRAVLVAGRGQVVLEADAQAEGGGGAHLLDHLVGTRQVGRQDDARLVGFGGHGLLAVGHGLLVGHHDTIGARSDIHAAAGSPSPGGA